MHRHRSARTIALRLAATALMLAPAMFAACSSDKRSESGTTPAASDASPTAATAGDLPTAAAAPAGPTTFKVLAGKAEGAMDIEMFMPAAVHVREGDSIEWTAQGFEGHTITFATDTQLQEVFKGYLQPDPEDPQQQIFSPLAAFPAGGNSVAGDNTYVNSGFIGVPTEATYTLTFTKRGVYQYLCLVHPFTMRGTVSVDAPDARVDAPEAVAARGQAELARYLDVERAALDEATKAQRSFPAYEGRQLHKVTVGLTTDYGQVATFVAPKLDIKAGDTVIFENDDRDFHNVVFKGNTELKSGVSIRPGPDGKGINYVMEKSSALAVDPGPEGFGPETFLSSGSMGITMPRLTWRLTFDRPGTYVYNCTIHILAGMAGVITVR
jgi:plastocyanin